MIFLFAIAVCLVFSAASGPVAARTKQSFSNLLAEDIDTQHDNVESDEDSISLLNHESLDAGAAFTYGIIDSCGYSEGLPLGYFFGIALRECVFNGTNNYFKYTDSFGTPAGGSAYPQRSFIIRHYSDSICTMEVGTPERQTYPTTCNPRARADSFTEYITLSNSLPSPAKFVIYREFGIVGCADKTIRKAIYSFKCTGASSSLSYAAAAAAEGCFAGSELVEKDSGDMVPISSIKVGDRILSASMRGELKYAEVVAVPHAHNEIEASFVTVTTAHADLKLTAEHLLRAGVCGFELSLINARDVRVGDCAMTAAGPALVIAVGSVKGKGIYSVVTTEELIVVNGFITSPFAVNHFAANAFYNVHRILYAMAPSLMKSTVPSMIYEQIGHLLSSVI